MTEENNISDFNLCTAFVLKQMYDAFPVPVSLNTGFLQPADDPNRVLAVYSEGPGRGETDERQQHSVNVYCWAVHFLIREGFIHDLHKERMAEIQSRNGNAPLGPAASSIFKSLVLTAKGLAALDAMPKTIQGPPISFIDRIRKGLAENSLKGVRDTITALIASTVTGLIL